MLSVPHLIPLSIGLLCILNSPVEAGWRPLSSPSSSSWASSIQSRLPSSPLSSPNKQVAPQKRKNGNEYTRHSSMEHTSSSVFGVGYGRRQRYLASIVAAASIRGGESSEDDDNEVEDSDDDAEEEIIVTINNDDLPLLDESDNDILQQSESAVASPISNKIKDDGNNNDDHDEERYSRQMYALGARAHKLVRSTTAILDGPLGGRGSSSSSRRRAVGNNPSGLLYEIAKNLALSGVGRIVLVREDDRRDEEYDGDNTAEDDSGYFDGSLDDLGAAYRRAALAEIGTVHPGGSGTPKEYDDEEEGDGELASGGGGGWGDDGAMLLAEYIRRLNPGVQVDIVCRSDLFRLLSNPGAADDNDDNEGEDNEAVFSDDENEDCADISLGTNPVVVCVDRSTTAQLKMNDVCRRRGEPSEGDCTVVPFVSVETAGVHAKLFCDFGSNFVVVDEDGETPSSTLLDRVEVNNPDDDNTESTTDEISTIHCLEGERHDVSMGDVIEFQGEHNSDDGSLLPNGGGGKTTFPKCQVVSVKSPTCFMVKEWRDRKGESKNQAEDDKEKSSKTWKSLLEGKARSFSRVKVPKQLSFSSLRQILQPSSLGEGQKATTTTVSDCWENDTLFAPILDKSFDPVRRRAVMTCTAALDAFVRKYGRLPSKSRPTEKNGGGSSSSKQKRTDMERFHSLVRKMAKEKDDDSSPATTSNEKQRWESLVDQFARTCRAKFTPVQALSGAVGAQEVLKAATGLYNPVCQFLLYDCDEVLQGDLSEEEEKDAEECKHDDEADMVTLPEGQSYILGERTSRKLARSRLFLVGAGAIGCELLKNLAAMGAGTGGGGGKKGRAGRLILTDMDTIEKSNLSRQLLFRDHDVGEFKSVAARAAMSRFSSGCRVETHTCRVGEDEEGGPFDDDFWSSGCDVVLNALDNVEARLFVDSQCVAHGLGLIDAGTLGPKGNMQVVVPNESESYGSSADPPEPSIPVCTLKNFPYEISHTIQWARDLFDGYFYRRPKQANDHVNEIAAMEDLGAFGRTLIEKLGEDAASDMAEELGEDLGPFPFIVGNADCSDPEYVLAVKKVSLNWAIREAHRLFYVAMDELLQKHPADSVDDDGAAFWSGTRRKPRPLRFIPLGSEEDEVSAQQVIINERIAQFVRSAARLRMESFLAVDDNQVGDESSSISLEEALVSLEEQAKLLYKKKKSKEILHNLSGGASSDDVTMSQVLEKLNGAKTGASFLPILNIADFEKDDESNGHVAFVTAASNLRAMSYGIPPADAMETRRVAGRIVPAMITTTGLVSALSCLELVKMVRGGLPLAMHRNSFVNLALPFFAFTAPVPAEEVGGVDGKTHTIWDRITVKGGGNKTPTRTMTLGKFLKKIHKKAGCGEEIEISSISYGPFMIYANFLHGDDEGVLATPLLDTLRDAVISEDDDDDMFFEEDDAEEEGEKENTSSAVILSEEQKAILSKLERKRFIDFSVAVENIETGEEFELPPVRLVKDKERTHDENIEDMPQ